MKKLRIFLVILLCVCVTFTCKEPELLEKVYEMQQDSVISIKESRIDSTVYVITSSEIIVEEIKHGNEVVKKVKPKKISEDVIVEEVMIIPEEKDNQGDISYIIKDTMIVGEPTKVQLTISKNVAIKEVINSTETFTSIENIQTDKIRIERKMQAKLIDPVTGNFTISSITSGVQIIENNEITTWEWEVTPLKKGNNKLVLSIDILIDGDIGKTVKVYDGFIYVYSDLTFFEKVKIFFKEKFDYKWLFSTLIIPLFLYFYKRRKKKNEK